MFKTSLATVILICAVTLLSCSKEPGSKPLPRVGFVSNGVASFWVIADAGAKAAARDLAAEVQVLMPDGLDSQKRMIEDLVTRGVDGIAVSPIDPENQTSLLNEAAERTRLITQDSDAPASKRLMYIGMDNYAAGRMTGELVKEAMPEGGTVMIFIGRVEQDNARRRRQGVIDELSDRSYDPSRYDPPGTEPRDGKYRILGTLTDQFDRAKAKANCEDALSKYPDLGAMVGLFAYNPPLCLEALAQSGRLKKVQIVGFDEAEEVLQAIKDGNCYGTVVQNPYMYGYESVRVLVALAKGEIGVIPENKFMDIPARKIRKDNVEEFWADLRQKMGGAAQGGS